MFASYGGAVFTTSMTFVSKAALEDGVPSRLGLRKTISPGEPLPRTPEGRHGQYNAYCPKMEVDAETYEVRADGQLLTCEPARVLPMAQRYYLF
jgi:urease subunit alpha